MMKFRILLLLLLAPFIFNAQVFEQLQINPNGAPTNPTKGRFYVSNVDDNVYYYNGTAWEQVNGGGAFLQLAGGTMSGILNMGGNQINNSSRVEATGDIIAGDDLAATNRVILDGGTRPLIQFSYSTFAEGTTYSVADKGGFFMTDLGNIAMFNPSSNNAGDHLIIDRSAQTQNRRLIFPDTDVDLGLIGAGGGSGDVAGPASSTDNAIARYDLLTGKVLQGSGVMIDDTDNITGVNNINDSGAGVLNFWEIQANNILNIPHVSPDPANVGDVIVDSDTGELKYRNSSGVQIVAGATPTTNFTPKTSTNETLTIADASIGNQVIVLEFDNAADQTVTIDDTGLTTAHYFWGVQVGAGKVQAADMDSYTNSYQETSAIGDKILWQYKGGGIYTIDGKGEYVNDFILSLNPDFSARSSSVVSVDQNEGTEITEWSNAAQATPDAVAGVAPQVHVGGTSGQVQVRFVEANLDYLNLFQTHQFVGQTDEMWIAGRIGDTFDTDGTVIAQAVNNSADRAFQIFTLAGNWTVNLGGVPLDAGAAAAGDTFLLNVNATTYSFWVNGVQVLTNQTVGDGLAADINIGSRTNGAFLWNGDIVQLDYKIGAGVELNASQIASVNAQLATAE